MLNKIEADALAAEIIAAIPDADFEILFLHDVCGYTLKELGEHHGITEAAMSYRRKDAMRRARATAARLLSVS